MNWDEAKALAEGGSRVRRAIWADKWLRAGSVLKFIEEADEMRVVQATDFGAGEFQATDWTTDDPTEEEDVCGRPARVVEFNPPAAAVEALLSTDGLSLDIRAVLGAGTFGAYRLIFLVEGTPVATALATEPGETSVTVPASEDWPPLFTVSLRVESVLPLPPWTLTVSTVVKSFDFAVLRYSWTSGGGTDLDTRTALTEVDPSLNGEDVGWSRLSAVSGISGDYLKWGGDNTSPEGTEAVLIDFQKIATDFPGLSLIKVRLRANWFSSLVGGGFTITFEAWRGGTMVQDGTDFANEDGALVFSLAASRAVASNVSGDVDGDNCGTLIYRVRTRTATLSA